jgi:hypothetical protein
VARSATLLVAARMRRVAMAAMVEVDSHLVEKLGMLS